MGKKRKKKEKPTISTMNSVNMLAMLSELSERVNSFDCQALATRETPEGARLQGEHGHDGKYAQHSDNLIFRTGWLITERF